MASVTIDNLSSSDLNALRKYRRQELNLQRIKDMGVVETGDGGKGGEGDGLLHRQIQLVWAMADCRQ